MSSSGLGNGSPRGQAKSRQSVARGIARAVAERDRGRRRLNAATATVGFASVIAAGAVAAVLPGSTHQSVTTPGSSSVSNGGKSSPGGGSQVSGSGSASPGSGSGSAGSGSNSSNSSSNSSDSSNSGNLQQPGYAPVQSGGGGQATSGGTSGW